jgi:hypothetical protein
MRSWLTNGVLHGWIHKVTLPQTRLPSYALLGDAHAVVGSPGDPRARIHLDANYGFTSQSAMTFTLRHEAAHILHPELTDGTDEHEAQLDDIARACSP